MNDFEPTKWRGKNNKKKTHMSRADPRSALLLLLEDEEQPAGKRRHSEFVTRDTVVRV